MCIRDRGILITFGSYMKKDVSIEGSTKNVAIYDTAIAIMAGLMIVPAVFAFSGGDPDTCLLYTSTEYPSNGYGIRPSPEYSPASCRNVPHRWKRGSS